MAAATPTSRVDRKLQMREVLDWMVADGLIDAEVANKLLHESRFGRGGTRHPILVISEANLRSLKAPGPQLSADLLTEWLAGRVRMPFYHIDPLKIDLKAVTQVMSSEYAQRRGILPVEVSGKEVTIATSEPLMTSWEVELSQMLRLTISACSRAPSTSSATRASSSTSRRA
jgi:general secretion pathway protein E